MVADLPLVSVITCAYNAQDYIEETLTTVLGQTYPRIELIVVDDGSTDQTAAIAQSQGSRIHLISHENRGVASARNSGIAECAGEYLVFFDADDLMPADRIACQVDYMLRHRDVGLSFLDYRNFTGTVLADQTQFQTCPRLMALFGGEREVLLENPCESILQEWFGISGTMMLRKELLLKVSGFDPELRGSEDFSFAYRVARYTNIGAIFHVGMLRRLHTGNLSSHSPTMLPARVKSFTKLLSTEANQHTRPLLKQHLATAWLDLARFEVDRRNFLRALACEIHAVSSNFETGAVWRLGRNTCRAVAIFAGLHRPAGR